ncbi:MAG TPA: hypothetical protein VFM96_06350 [Gaiellaceae bacterium]|nr:hypothetical protein [Gaiellaceae bacterium]
MKTLLAVLAALVIVPAASASYPTPYAAQGIDSGLSSRDGSIRFVALKSGSDTNIQALQTGSGAQVMSQIVPGQWGIPMITYSLAGGLFHDGSAFVLQSVGMNDTTKFAVLGTSDLALRDTIALDGYYSFDALSPDGSMLYLIEHTSTQDFQHYVVRAYDLRAHTLLEGRIADKAQKSWVMQGSAVTRVTSPTGRWVYTLYANPGGYPFVHALDTVNGVAHCVGIPWKAATQEAVYQLTLSLKGSRLAVRYANGSTYRVITTGTWRVSRP